jgi:hypothetical protein
MATVQWDKALDLITPDIPTCPEAVIKKYFPIVASDFFARTHLWRVSMDGQNTVIDQAEYDVSSDAIDTVIESVLWLKVDNKNMTHTDSRLVNHEFLNKKGQPTHFWVVNDTALRLFLIPDQVWAITGEVAVKPSRTARGMPDWVYQTWIDPIVCGVLYRLCKMKDKDWTDPEFAAMNKNIYEQAVTNARIRDLRNVHLQVRMRSF